jgi:hypothetical protein
VSSSIFGHLEASLHGYLEDTIQRAAVADGQTAASLGRFELPRIAAALQAVLNEHEPDENGRCRTCRRRRFGRPTAPCRAYLTAHLCLLVTEDDLPGDSYPSPPIDATVLRHHLGAAG